MNVFDPYVFELSKFAGHINKGSQLPNIKTLNIHNSSPAFTRSVCSNMYHVPEVRTKIRRESPNYQGTLLLNHLLKTKMLHCNYESSGKKGDKK